MVLPATPGGSPAAREWQVNVPLTRNNDLPYGFLGRSRILSRTQPARRGLEDDMLSKLADDTVVLTGCGWVTPYAVGTIAEVLRAGAETPAPSPPEGGYWAVPDDFRDRCPEMPKELTRDAGGWLAALAFEHASKDASLDRDTVEAQRIGLVLGCAWAGQLGMIGFANEVREQSARFVSPIHFPQTVGNYIAGALARGYGIRGPNVTLANDVACGLEAVIEGAALLESGVADVVFAGGTDRLSPELAGALAEPQVVPSEGACLFVMERLAHAKARGASFMAAVTPLSDVEVEFAGAGVARKILSTASWPLPGAVVIEHQVGRCFAALGAATVAAAIGAAHGLPVPCAGSADDAAVSVTSLSVEDHLDAEGNVLALAVVDAGAGHLIGVDLRTYPNNGPSWLRAG